MLRWSVLRAGISVRNFNTTGQLGDGRETAAADYVVAHARHGDLGDVIAKMDQYSYDKAFLVSVGDEKGKLLDAAVKRANPRLALELGTYCGYGALRIAAAAPSARIFSVELGAANALVAQRIWNHAGVADQITCVVGTIGDGGHTLDRLRDQHGFAADSIDFLFIDHDKNAYLADLLAIAEQRYGFIATDDFAGFSVDFIDDTFGRAANAKISILFGIHTILTLGILQIHKKLPFSAFVAALCGSEFIL